MQVCQQVLKNVLDKIEKEEKNLFRKQRQKESAEERKIRASTNKLTALLYKHTEFLRKDIMKKRALVEKELQIDIQVSKVGYTLVNLGLLRPQKFLTKQLELRFFFYLTKYLK